MSNRMNFKGASKLATFLMVGIILVIIAIVFYLAFLIFQGSNVEGGTLNNPSASSSVDSLGENLPADSPTSDPVVSNSGVPPVVFDDGSGEYNEDLPDDSPKSESSGEAPPIVFDDGSGEYNEDLPDDAPTSDPLNNNPPPLEF